MNKPQEVRYFHLYKKGDDILRHISFKISGNQAEIVTWNESWLHEIDRTQKVSTNVARKRYQSLLKDGFSKEK